MPADVSEGARLGDEKPQKKGNHGPERTEQHCLCLAKLVGFDLAFVGNNKQESSPLEESKTKTSRYTHADAERT